MMAHRPEDLTTLRLALYDNGYYPVPVSGPDMQVTAAGKRPVMKDWQKVCAAANKAEIERWATEQPDCTNTGLITGLLVGVDIDILDEALSAKVEDLARTCLGPNPVRRVGKAPKVLLPYRAAQPFKKLQTKALVMPDGTPVKVEILGVGQQFVAFGIHPDTGQDYEWTNKSPLDVPLAELPAVTEAQCADFLARAETLLRQAGAVELNPAKDRKKDQAGAHDHNGEGNHSNGKPRSPAEEALHREAEAVARTPETGRNDALNKAAFKLGRLVALGVLAEGDVEDALFDAATRNGLVADDGEEAVKATINSGLKGGRACMPDLDALPDEAAMDPNVVFAPANVEGLSELKKFDQRRFEDIRSKLKTIKNLRIAELDKAIGKVGRKEGVLLGPDANQADVLVALASSAEVFHTQDGVGYADVLVHGHRQTHAIFSKGFNQWLRHKYYMSTGQAPGSEAMKSALGTIDARAQFEGEERQVYLRVANCGDKIFIDLVNDERQALEVGPDGWRIVDDPPVRFRRSPGMLPLPIPKAGGSINALRRFINVANERDFVLVVCWLLAALLGRGPFPVLVLNGEHGTAKSTLTEFLRKLVDPSTAALQSLPKNGHDLFITANNAWVLAFDNLSTLSDGMSDLLCRLSTGGGMRTRQLYTDQDEILFEATRPIVANGITIFVKRSDLMERTMAVTLERIPENRRRPEAELDAEFEAELPGIFGALLDAIAHGLKNLPHIRLDHHPRMADFAKCAVACETAFWAAGTFMTAFDSARAAAVDDLIDADPVASAVCAMMVNGRPWDGTATELLNKLTNYQPEDARRPPYWPANAQYLSMRLEQAKRTLWEAGIDIVKKREGHGRARKIYISRRPEKKDSYASSASSASSASADEDDNDFNDMDKDATGDEDADADEGDDEPDEPVRDNPLKHNETGRADAEDATSQGFCSGEGKRSRFAYAGPSQRVIDFHRTGEAERWKRTKKRWAQRDQASESEDGDEAQLTK